MNRVTKVASLLGATALAMSVTACGGDSGGDYCDELEGDGPGIANMEEAMSDPDAMAEATDAIQGIADSAPDDVKEDWNAVSDMFTTLSDLEVDFSDPEAMSDPEVMEQLESMGDVQTNLENISTHAQEECDVELGVL